MCCRKDKLTVKPENLASTTAKDQDSKSSLKTDTKVAPESKPDTVSKISQISKTSPGPKARLDYKLSTEIKGETDSKVKLEAKCNNDLLSDSKVNNYPGSGTGGAKVVQDWTGSR